MDEVDFAKYENRLQTFNSFPPVVPVFIKDLVEAGFCYSGENSLVFCFACGFMYENWKEHDDPCKIHLEGNNNCPYLRQRSDKHAVSQVASALSIAKGRVHFFWDQKNRCLIKVDKATTPAFKVVASLLPRSIGHHVASAQEKTDCVSQGKHLRFPPIKKNVGYENLPAAGDHHGEAGKDPESPNSPQPFPTKGSNCLMRNNGNRFRSLTTHFPLLGEKFLRPFADAGLYYPGYGDCLRCFACPLSIDDWQTFANPIYIHYNNSPNCPHVRSYMARSKPSYNLVEEDSGKVVVDSLTKEQQSGTALELVAKKTQVLTGQSFTCLPAHISGRNMDDLPKIIVPSREQIHNMQNNSKRNGGGSCSSMESSPLPQEAMQRTSPSGNLTSLSPDGEDSLRQVKESSFEKQSFKSSTGGVSPKEPVQGAHYFHGMDMSLRDRRLQTFSTWPQECPVEPFDLAEAGFYYTGYMDGVKCYACSTALKDWRLDDTAWGEHCRWSSDCPLVQQYLLNMRPQPRTIKHKPQQDETELMDKVTPSVCTLDRIPSKVSPEHNQSNLTETKYPRVFNSEHFETLTDSTDIVESSVSNNQESITDELFDVLIDGKPLANARVVQEILDMGFTCQLIKEVKDAYLTQFGSYFVSPDEIIEAIICYQETGSLSTLVASPTTNEQLQKNTHPVCDKLTTELKGNGPQSDDNVQGPTEVNEKLILQQELEKAREMQLCKICMDAQVGVVFLPCGHLICCQDCAVGIKDCPMCRATIMSSIRTFLS